MNENKTIGLGLAGLSILDQRRIAMKSADQDVLLQLANHPNQFIRAVLLGNPNFDHELLDKDESQIVQSLLKKRRSSGEPLTDEVIGIIAATRKGTAE